MTSLDTEPLLAPTHRIELGGRPIDDALSEAFVGAVIERAERLVDTAELVFRDPHFRLQSHPLFESGISVRVFLADATDARSATASPVFDGEIVSGELRLGGDRPPVWKVRAFHRLHRLTLHRRTRAFTAGPLVSRVAEIAQACGWSASAPDRWLPAMLQKERTDFSTLRLLALRTGLEVRLEDGVLSLAEPSARPVLDLEESRVERLQVVRACEPAAPSSVSAWDPLERELMASDAVGITRHLEASQLADRADADALAGSLDRRAQAQANELRLTTGSGALDRPGDRFRLIDAAPIFDGVWQVAAIRHEFGATGARMRVVAHPAPNGTLE